MSLISKSILDVDCENYTEWFRDKKEEELVDFFNLSDESIPHTMNHRYITNTWSSNYIQYIDGNRIGSLGDPLYNVLRCNESASYNGSYEPEEKQHEIHVKRGPLRVGTIIIKKSTSELLVEKFLKSKELKIETTDNLRTMRGLENYCRKFYKEELCWMCKGKMRFLESLRIEIYKLYCDAAALPTQRVQKILQEKAEQYQLMAEEKHRSDERISVLTKIANQLTESFALYLPVGDAATPYIKAKATKYFEENFKLDNPQLYVDYIFTEYKNLETALDKELLGFTRSYILALIELYPR